jgi:SAM-dependent methyltransferase
METLPFSDAAFEGVIAYNVIYHTTLVGMRRVLAEIRRTLRPGGSFYATVIAREDSKVADCRTDIRTGKCEEIEPFTFIYRRDAPGDKYLPHHYCDAAELDALLDGFAVDDLNLKRVTYTDDDGAEQIGAHYHIQARRL